MAKLLIYGAYGYSGELIARRALDQGLHPVLAGRDREKLTGLAGCLDLEARVFAVEDARDHLHEVGLVLNCAGPFTATAEPLMDACIALGSDYLDITGEVAVFESAWRRDERAREAGVLLCPGVGFTAVPTDCLALSLKKLVPAADHLTLAFDFGTRPSPGTINTGLQAIHDGGRVRRNGRLVRVPVGSQVRRIPFAGGSRAASTIPWGDVFTAWHSTGIDNIDVYAAMPWLLAHGAWMINGLKPVFGNAFMLRQSRWLVSRFMRAPDTGTRASQPAQFWGEVSCPRGRRATGTLTGPNVYDMTAELAVEIALACLRDGGGGGFRTPVKLVGSDFFDRRPGYQLTVNEAA